MSAGQFADPKGGRPIKYRRFLLGAFGYLLWVVIATLSEKFNLVEFPGIFLFYFSFGVASTVAGFFLLAWDSMKNWESEGTEARNLL